jgi:hypothetical protein
MRPGDDGVDGGALRATRKQRREGAREERRATEAAERRSAAVRRRLRLIGCVALALLAAASVAALAARGGHAPKPDGVVGGAQPKLVSLSSLGGLKTSGAPGPFGPEGVPIPQAPPLATTATAAGGGAVDGIECSTSEQTLFHVHAHLTVFVNGAARQVPYGIGIPGARTDSTPVGPFVGSGECFYWLHTHAADGIIHIESPVERNYTLGDFFDVWGQPLSRSRVGPAAGPVTALYDGERYEGDPRAIPLTAHAQIQLEVGRPLVAPDAIRFPAGL